MRHNDLENPAFFRALSPGLAIEQTVDFTRSASGGKGSHPESATSEVAALLDPGFVRWPDLLSPSSAQGLADAVDALVHAGLPPTFLYVYDEAWSVLPRLLAHGRAIQGDTEVLPDLWAWRIPPGRRGWTAHRGSTRLERTGEGHPALLNVWLALSDVSTTGACIHVLPKNDDPFHPSELDRAPSEIPESVLARAIALPTRAGEALAWDANVLHWGGESASDAPPRRSYSFTLRARGKALPSTSAIALDALTFRARLDAIATSIVTYADTEDVPEAIQRWARATTALTSLRWSGTPRT